MVRREIIKLIQKATGEKPEKIRVERPEEASHGDYSTNIALQLKRSPAEIAEKLRSDLFKKIEIAGPGFIGGPPGSPVTLRIPDKPRPIMSYEGQSRYGPEEP